MKMEQYLAHTDYALWESNLECNTNELNAAYSVSTATGHSSQAQGSSSYADELMFLFFANKSSSPQLDNEDLEQIDQDDLEEINLKWQVAMLSMRVKRFYKKTGRKLEFNGKEPVGFDKTKVECFNCHRRGHFARDCRSDRNLENRSRDARNVGYQVEEEATDFDLKAFTLNPSSSFSSNSKREKLGKANIEIIGYQHGLESIERQLRVHQQNEVIYEEKIEVLEYQVKDKKEEVTETVFDNRSSDEENSLAIDRFKKGEGYHAVPPHLTGNYMPPKSDLSFAGLDNSIYTFKRSETVTSVTKDEKDALKTSTTCVDKPKEDMSGRIPVSAAKPKAATSTSAAKPINTAGPKQSVNFLKSRSTFYKSHSPIRSYFYNAIAHSRRNSTERVNTTGSKVVSAVKGNRVTAVKTSASCVWRPRVNDIEQISKDNRWICKCVDYVDPQGSSTTSFKNKGIVNSGCSRHMTENKAYLADYQEINDGGFVAFGSSKGKITDKASIDESNLWHKRLGHVKFKTMNKLVKGNLVKGLPLNIFENDHTYVTYQKGKHHKATYKAKLVSSISQPLQIFHMNLFGPTSVMSINHKKYCLVVTDDFSRFTWVFFLATKDETSKVLKPFITAIENQINKKVKVIRCDNGSEFKNRDLDEFCGIKRIKREYSNTRTPQQNRVAKRKNRTLIKVTRTMPANSLLPITFWAEAVNTACYVLNRDLVTKSHNKTPYELLNGRTPRLDFMRPFGCSVTILNTLDPLGKFKGKVDEGFLVGYSVTRNQTDKNAGLQDTNGNAGTQDNIDAGKEVSDQHYIVLPLWSSISSTFKSSDDKAADDKPKDDTSSKTVKEPVNKEDQAYKDELDRLLSQEKEARTVSAGGPTSPHPDAFIPSNTLLHLDQDDSQIPDLEYTAELQSTEEEVYVSQPPRFVDLQFPNKVYKVEKAFYGLHQAPRAWYETLSTFLLQNGYRRGTIDKTFFIKKEKDDIMLVQVYVNDIIFGSTKKSLCDEFEALMHKRFHMSSMGELTFFLVLQVKQSKEGIFISQDTYVDEILKKFDFSSIKIASTPIETQKPLVKDVGAADVDVHLYRSMIGSLMYLTAFRPDIMFAVCACSRFQVTPKLSYLHVVKRIFRYLKGGCQFLGRRLISWQCKKQTIVATSTTKAEDSFEKKLIQVLKIHTDDNVADLLTKAFDYCYAKLCAAGQKVSTAEPKGDNVERAITTDVILVRVQDNDNITKIQSTTMSNDPISQEINLGDRPRSGEDIMEHPDDLTDFVPPTAHDSPLSGGHTPGKELNLIDGADTEVIVKEKSSGEKGGSIADQVSTARPEVSAASVPVIVSAATLSTPLTITTIFGDEDLTIAQTLIKLKSKKGMVKGVAFKDIEEPHRLTRSTTTLQTLLTIDPKDKGKGVLVEEEPEKLKKVKRKDQGLA
nr:ribonuclease H-like domain-containing protein [Tanacetum cinerariifolium]